MLHQHSLSHLQQHSLRRCHNPPRLPTVTATRPIYHVMIYYVMLSHIVLYHTYYRVAVRAGAEWGEGPITRARGRSRLSPPGLLPVLPWGVAALPCLPGLPVLHGLRGLPRLHGLPGVPGLLAWPAWLAWLQHAHLLTCSLSLSPSLSLSRARGTRCASRRFLGSQRANYIPSPCGRNNGFLRQSLFTATLTTTGSPSHCHRNRPYQSVGCYLRTVEAPLVGAAQRHRVVSGLPGDMRCRSSLHQRR